MKNLVKNDKYPVIILSVLNPQGVMKHTNMEAHQWQFAKLLHRADKFYYFDLIYCFCGLDSRTHSGMVYWGRWQAGDKKIVRIPTPWRNEVAVNHRHKKRLKNYSNIKHRERKAGASKDNCNVHRYL